MQYCQIESIVIVIILILISSYIVLMNMLSLKDKNTTDRMYQEK
jgi:hypothetical protein